MASKTKIFIVLEFVTGGELFDKIVNHGRMREDEARKYFQQLINAVDYCHSRGVFHRDLKPENLLLDAAGNLKVSDFGLSALSQQVRDDGLLHTTCGTPNYVAPEVLNDRGYDGATADLWSCGVILFVLLAGYLPFDDSNLMNLYKKISNAEFTCPPWLSFGAMKLITRILDPNPEKRITVPEILEDEWFKKDYKPPVFDENEDTNLDDVEPSEGSCELDVWPYLQTLTSDAISRTAFGSNYEEGRKIFELQKEQAVLLMKSFVLAFIPGWRFLPTKANRRMEWNLKEVESLVLGIINKRTKAIEAGEASCNDLLDILLESNFREIQQNGSKFGMSMQEVIEECKLFYIAGQETTSALLVWTMILLGKHSDWQARAREEILQVLGSGKPDFEGLNSLKIITMIFYEVLRLYPPAIMFGRTIHKRTTIGNINLPGGAELILPAIILHHDRELWGNDAKEFNPERFSEGVSKATKDHRSYFPFGWGPRMCVGQNFAMLEAKMAMTMILRRYSFELSPSYLHAPYTVLTLQPQHGAHLILHKL